jgi:uncharacterized damage-inducible protein DinB
MSNELLTEYTKSVNDFLAEVDGIAPGDLLKSPKAGEWSVGFVIHHIADGSVHFTYRFLNALTVDEPKIVPYDEDVYPDRLNYIGRDVAASKATITALSIFTTSLLMNIKAEDWKRISFHPEAGNMSVADILTKVISHNNAHTNQIREIKAAL